MAVPIPEAFRDLIVNPVTVAIVTIMPDGTPQATAIWWDFDGTNVLINTARGRQKDKNMKIGAKVTFLAIDPANANRYLEVRGQVISETEEGALEHANSLSLKYRGESDFYQRAPQRRGTETRVIYKIEPLHCTTHI